MILAGRSGHVFKTVLNTPFFFNFHEGDIGHTAIVGPKSCGKTLLINFLLAQSQKFNPKIFIFDFNNSSQCFVEISGGNYFDLNVSDSSQKNYLSINPLELPQTNASKDFLENFFTSLVIFRKDHPTQQELSLIPEIIDRIFAANCQNFIDATQAFNTPETIKIFNDLQIWSEGKLNHIFTDNEDFKLNNYINGFDLTKYQEHKPVLIPIFLYILQRIENQLDGSPSIIVINQALDLIGNVFFNSQILNFLERLRKKNCVVIFEFDDSQIADFSDLVVEARKLIASEIFFPNSNPSEIYKNVFDFPNDEIEILKMMEIKDRHILIKHADESLIASINFDDFHALSKILSCDQKTITVMQTIIGDLINSNPSANIELEALPIIIEALENLENDRLAKEKAKIIEETARQRKLLREKLELNEID